MKARKKTGKTTPVYRAYSAVTVSNGFETGTQHTFDTTLPPTADDQAALEKYYADAGAAGWLHKHDAFLLGLEPITNPYIRAHADEIKKIVAGLEHLKTNGTYTNSELAQFELAFALRSMIVALLKPSAAAKAPRKDKFHRTLASHFEALRSRPNQDQTPEQLRKHLLASSAAKVQPFPYRKTTRDFLVLTDINGKSVGKIIDTERSLKDALQRALAKSK